MKAIDVLKIKEQLPVGAIQEIAKRTELSRATISLVMSGKARSAHKPEIIKCAVALISEYKEREREAFEAYEMLETA